MSFFGFNLNYESKRKESRGSKVLQTNKEISFPVIMKIATASSEGTFRFVLI